MRYIGFKKDENILIFINRMIAYYKTHLILILFLNSMKNVLFFLMAFLFEC